VRIDRVTFAKQQPPPPPLAFIQVVCPCKLAVSNYALCSSSSRILQCHCLRSPRRQCVVLPSAQDAHAAPDAQGPQVIRFQRAAAPLGADLAASARAAVVAQTVAPAEPLSASGAVAETVSSEPGPSLLGQAQAPDPMHPAQQSSRSELAATSPVQQPTSAASGAQASEDITPAARSAAQPSRLAAMLALQQVPPPHRPGPNQPTLPAAAPAAVEQQAQMFPQPGPESSSAAPATSASVASPGPPQGGTSSPALQPASPASMPDWGSGWAAAPGLGTGPVADQAAAIAAGRSPSSGEQPSVQPSHDPAAAGEASASGHGAQRLPRAADGARDTGANLSANLSAGQPAAAPAPGVQTSAPQTRPSAASPAQLPAQPPQRDKSAWATHTGRRTLRQQARQRRRASRNTAPAKPGGCVLRAGRLIAHGAHAIRCIAVRAWYRVQPQAIGRRCALCQRRGDLRVQRSRPCRAGPPGWMCRQRLVAMQQLRSLAPLHLRLAGTW
jgi:hypothetical protein